MSVHALLPVHRLDRLTSGVLIIARNTSTARSMQQIFSQRDITKQYIARVRGDFRDVMNGADCIEVDQPIAAAVKHLGHYHIDATRGKRALTKFQFISYNGHTSLVQCSPHTGITHQIRVHLQYLQHPIVNDINYGGKLYKSNSHDLPLPLSDSIVDGCADCIEPNDYDNAEHSTRHCTYIYLHAHKYTYNQQQYQTKLPKWASDNFDDLTDEAV